MKKNLIFITLLLSVCMLHADPMHDLENAIKENDHARVVELSKNRVVSQTDYDRLNRCAQNNHEMQLSSTSSLNRFGTKLSALGMALSGGISLKGATVCYGKIKENDYKTALLIGLIVEPISICATVYSAIKFKKSFLKLIAELDSKLITSTISGLKIKQTGSDNDNQAIR